MTVTAPAELRDAKAGFCGRCRSGNHALCASPPGRCSCTADGHRNRPSGAPVTTAPAEPPAAGARPIDDPMADVRKRAAATVPLPAASADICGSCRRSQHTNCTRPSCSCTFARHANRRAGTGDPKPATKLREPVWQLVKADPPAPPPKAKKPTAVERARPFVEEIMAEGDRDWHRFAVFPSSMAAAQTKGRVAKAYREFEFQAVRVPEIGQSALYGRWLGKSRNGQL